jgi:pSer/pThr/pTyr-binding forkhead associated (FHA) protein
VLAQLIPVNGDTPITIQRDITLVGRQRDQCDLVLENKSVSKLHCVLVRTDGLLFVRDLSSTNGTKVNGQRVIRGALLPGDQLSIASEKFRVHLGPGADDYGEAVVRDRTEMIVVHEPIPVANGKLVGTGSKDTNSDVSPVDDIVE